MINILNDGTWEHLTRGAETIPDSWSKRCADSIREEKREVEKRKKELIPKFIPLDVDKLKWIQMVKELKEEYSIMEGTRQDEQASRRIAILVGELYLTHYEELRTGEGILDNGPLMNVMIIEKEISDVAMEHRLTCDTLDREYRVKHPNYRKLVLYAWGVDKRSGLEGYTTQLKEWTAEALVLASEPQTTEKGEEEDGKLGTSGNVDRGRTFEADGNEETRVSTFALRQRDAFRSTDQEQTTVS